MRVLRSLGLLLLTAVAAGAIVSFLRRRAASPGPEPWTADKPGELLDDLGKQVERAKEPRNASSFELLDLGTVAAVAAEAAADGGRGDDELLAAVAERTGEIPAAQRPFVLELARAKGRGAKALEGRTLAGLSESAAELLSADGNIEAAADRLARQLYDGQRIPRAVRAAARAASELAARSVATAG
jgi:hypothetical protein